MRERDIKEAIRAALEATGEFDGIFLFGFADASDSEAEAVRAVSILPMGFKEDDKWDGVLDGQMLEMGRLKIVIRVREGNAPIRDSEADRLLSVLRNAVNGRALNILIGEDFLYPQWTKITEGNWKDPLPPERDIECTFQYLYDAPDWTGFDTSP